MDYSYYSINQVPLVTYGMIAITTGVLVFVSLSDDKGTEAPAEEYPAEEEQVGGRRRKRRSKQKHPGKRSTAANGTQKRGK
jgi:hypothetical protein